MDHIKEKSIRLITYLGFLAAAIFIYGCTDSASPEDEQGQIMITIVDAPANFDQVNIDVARVEVHVAGSDSSSGWIVINNTATTYDLLTLRNGASAVLGNNSLDAGHYTQIRLILGTGSNVVVNGTTYPLDVPGGTQTGIKLNREFDIQQGFVYEVTLDFDVEHSILLTGSGQYIMNPIIRVVPTQISGTISGKINPLIAAASVYAISGTDSIGTVAETTTGSFLLMALIQGTYDVKVYSGNAAYNDTTIVDVIVAAKQNTDLGTITLSLK